jgi:TRAP-type C4-dicarboxylate transport system substrate-binding protein
MFKQAVQQRTNGYYDVQIFPAQQLGGLRDQVKQTILSNVTYAGFGQMDARSALCTRKAKRSQAR